MLTTQLARAAAIAALVAVSAPSGAAQVPVTVGAQVRVRADLPYGEVAGRVSRVDRSAVQVVQPPTDAPLIVPVNAVRSIEVRTPRSAARGALHWGGWGAAGGALLGLAAGAAFHASPLAAAGGGALAGFAGGGAYGASHPGFHWTVATLQAPRAAPAPRTTPVARTTPPPRTPTRGRSAPTRSTRTKSTRPRPN